MKIEYRKTIDGDQWIITAQPDGIWIERIGGEIFRMHLNFSQVIDLFVGLAKHMEKSHA